MPKYVVRCFLFLESIAKMLCFIVSKNNFVFLNKNCDFLHKFFVNIVVGVKPKRCCCCFFLFTSVI